MLHHDSFFSVSDVADVGKDCWTPVIPELCSRFNQSSSRIMKEGYLECTLFVVFMKNLAYVTETKNAI